LVNKKVSDYFSFSAADEPGTLAQPRRYFTKVSSLLLLGLEYFYEYFDRYFTQEQMRRGFRRLPISFR